VRSRGPGTSAALAVRALRLVLLLGAVSFFADTTYEGARSVLGPFLGALGASAFVVGAVTGVGELASYGLRPLSGRLTDRLRRPWVVAIPGYLVNLIAVPLLALAGAWPVAAGLFVLERVGKGLRNPPRDAMLSYAGRQVGSGWAFGVHEALDQSGAVVGPLAVALVLFSGGSYRSGFAYLALPAIASLILLAVARAVFPTPADLEPLGAPAPPPGSARFRGVLVGAAFLGAGVVGFPLVSFFFVLRGTVAPPLVPVLYAVGMAAEGLSALGLGRLFERLGPRTLVLASAVAAGSAPLLFTPNAGLEFAGMALWGVGMGAQTSVLNAVVALATPKATRASAFGELQGVLGGAGLASGLAMGALLGVYVPALVATAVGLELVAVGIFVRTVTVRRPGGPEPTDRM
jgi:MFS family permease